MDASPSDATSSDALGLENALAGHMEVRVKLAAHGLCYANAWSPSSLWSSGFVRAVKKLEVRVTGEAQTVLAETSLAE